MEFYGDFSRFSQDKSYIMHIDINSCFATIEQQANQFLRGKPIVVAAYTTDRGCILASSIEAKKLGIKTGMRVFEGRRIYPNLIVLPPDPPKYRSAHLALREIVSGYTNSFTPRSIDEFVLNMRDQPTLVASSMQCVAREIKRKIKKQIGERVTVSIGIGPSRFIAKTAASLHKPDGLDEINKDNFMDVYSGLKLTDLCGINTRSELKLKGVGIRSVLDFYNASESKLRVAFKSINSYYWYFRLRGYEVDDIEFERRGFGNSFALPKPESDLRKLAPILVKLIEKMSFRLRKANFRAYGVCVGVLFWDCSVWHKRHKFSRAISDSRDFYKRAFRMLGSCTFERPVRNLSVSCFDLVADAVLQLDLFEDRLKDEKTTKALDLINKRFGDYSVATARMVNTQCLVIDRIAFSQHLLL
jgi:DNA polymerase-4